MHSTRTNENCITQARTLNEWKKSLRIWNKICQLFIFFLLRNSFLIHTMQKNSLHNSIWHRFELTKLWKASIRTQPIYFKLDFTLVPFSLKIFHIFFYVLWNDALNWEIYDHDNLFSPSNYAKYCLKWIRFGALRLFHRSIWSKYLE